MYRPYIYKDSRPTMTCPSKTVSKSKLDSRSNELRSITAVKRQAKTKQSAIGKDGPHQWTPKTTFP